MKDYKKILEGVVNIINTAEKSDIGFTNICTYIGENCPELKESEDERIRKDCIKYLNWEYQHCPLDEDKIKIEKCIAWLERQAEQKPIEPKFKVGDKIYLKPEYRMPTDDTPIANTVKEIKEVDNGLYKFDGAYIFIEDQDKYELVEQKPTDEEMKVILHTEYEKGRADVIADTLSWLENCWPKYCSNQTIIEGFKEAIKD